MKPAPPVMSSVPMARDHESTKTRNLIFLFRAFAFSWLNRCAFWIHEREPQFLRQRVDRRPRALPGAFGLEPQVADAAAPRRDDAADRAEVRPIRVLLIEPLDHFGRDAHERAQRGGGADAVLPAVPRAAEHERDLLEVVDEELLRLLVRVAGLLPEDTVLGEQLLELLRQRRLRDPAAADAEQLDLVVERRVLAIVERADDVVAGGQRFVAVQLPAREADEV